MKARNMSGRGAPRIAVNGVFLDEVRTQIEEKFQRESVSYLSLPEEHHRVLPEGDELVLRLPALTALHLYHDGVLVSNRARAVAIEVAGEELGRFLVEGLRTVEPYEFGEPVLIRLVRVQDREV